MAPIHKAWIFGRTPVILFALTTLTWAVYITHSLSKRPSYPTYPDIGGIAVLVLYTFAFGVLAFLLAAFGIRSPDVSKRWAWSGLILNAPIIIYSVGYYPAVFICRLLATL